MQHRFTAFLGALAVFAALGALPAHAQQSSSATVSFGGIKGDPELPVTVTSAELTVDEVQGTAIFVGDVLVIQGQMRLSADEIRVEYDEETAKIAKLWATGNVLLVNADDAAQSDTAEYEIDAGLVTMLGNVVLSQSAATFSAQRFVADITTGLGQLEGGVTTSFVPSDVQKAAP